MQDKVTSLYDSRVLMKSVASLDVSQAATVNQLISDALHATVER